MPINTAKWKNRDILDPEDVDDLDMRAAVHEFHGSIPRHEAEEKAHQDYRNDKIMDSAAHHLRGIKSAHAIGDVETAKKHGAMYVLALKQLGHEDALNPPDKVRERSENPGKEFSHFKAHPGDYYSLPKEKEDEKKVDYV